MRLTPRMAEQLSCAFWVTNEAIRVHDPVITACELTPSQSSQLRVATWNLLAPPYAKGLESSEWRQRQQKQFQALNSYPDIIALQEFWNHPDSVREWQEWAADFHYTLFVLPRTRGKSDGCATLVKSHLAWSNPIGLGYDDWGDRVCLVVPIGDTVVLNTHWTFAHDNAWDPAMRQHQSRKLANYVKTLDKRVILLGDLNGEIEDPAVSSLQQAGFTLHTPAGDWKSHRAHTGDFLACDFVATIGYDCLAIDVMHDAASLQLQPPPRFRISDHAMVAATLHRS